MGIFANYVDILLEMEDEACELKNVDLLKLVRAEFPGITQKLADFGINIDKLYKIGAGCQGVAYSDGNLVVKITEDEQEARATGRTQETGNIKGVTNTLYVGKLGHPVAYARELWSHDAQFYLIIQELQSTDLTPLEKQIADLVGDYLVEHFHREESDPHRQGKGLIALFNRVKPTDGNIDTLAAKLTDEMFNQKTPHDATGGPPTLPKTPAATMIARQLFEAIIRLYYSAGVRYFDVSAGNVGKDRDGNYVVFDLGVSTTKGEAPTLDVLESHNFKHFGHYHFQIID